MNPLLERQIERFFGPRGAPESMRAFLEEVDKTYSERAGTERRTLSLLKSTLHSADGILVVGADGRIMLHNERFIRMWRVPIEAMAPGDGGAVLRAASAQLRDPDVLLRRTRETTDAEVHDTLELLDGRTIACTSFPQRLDGAAIGRVWMFHDITYIRRAAEGLRFTQFCLDHAAEGVFWTSADGRITYVNSAAARILGRPREALLGRPVSEFDEGWEETSRLGTVARETVYRRADGAQVPVEVTVNRLRFAGREQACVFFRDVTERRLLERQIREAQKMDAVGRLAGGVAHDFNNMLTAILGHAELLMESLPESDPRHGDAVEIHKAGGRAAGLTRQLLAFSRRQVMQTRVIDLNALVTDMQKMLRRLIGEHVDLTTRLEPSLARVQADPDQLGQVIMNLVINARDAMPSGGRVTIVTENADDGVVLSVEDTGCGMSDDVQAHLFEPFFTTKAAGKGTGLGLSTVYGIVRQSGGRVEVTSAPGRGSTFRVRLPRVASAAVVARGKAAPDGGRGTETVLLVEDDDAVRALVRDVLVGLGYRVVGVAHGGEALRVLERERVDIVVTDLVMPVMGGLELARRVKERGGGPRFLFTSGYPEEVDACGASAFLAKPFTPDVIARKVRETLAS